jgi:hypothetical protein
VGNVVLGTSVGNTADGVAVTVGAPDPTKLGETDVTTKEGTIEDGAVGSDVEGLTEGKREGSTEGRLDGLIVVVGNGVVVGDILGRNELLGEAVVVGDWDGSSTMLIVGVVVDGDAVSMVGFCVGESVPAAEGFFVGLTGFVGFGAGLTAGLFPILLGFSSTVGVAG